MMRVAEERRKFWGEIGVARGQALPHSSVCDHSSNAPVIAASVFSPHFFISSPSRSWEPTASIHTATPCFDDQFKWNPIKRHRRCGC